MYHMYAHTGPLLGLEPTTTEAPQFLPIIAHQSDQKEALQKLSHHPLERALTLILFK